MNSHNDFIMTAWQTSSWESVLLITITADFHTLDLRVITVQTSQLVPSAALCRHIASWPAHPCRRVDDCCPGSLARRATAREFDRRRVSALRTLLLIAAAATAAVTLLIVALLILLPRTCRPSLSAAGESTRRQRHWVLRADASRTLRSHVKLGNLQYTFNAPFRR